MKAGISTRAPRGRSSAFSDRNSAAEQDETGKRIALTPSARQTRPPARQRGCLPRYSGTDRRGQQPLDLAARRLRDRFGVVDVGRKQLTVWCHDRSFPETLLQESFKRRIGNAPVTFSHRGEIRRSRARTGRLKPQPVAHRDTMSSQEPAGASAGPRRRERRVAAGLAIRSKRSGLAGRRLGHDLARQGRPSPRRARNSPRPTGHWAQGRAKQGIRFMVIASVPPQA